jgi:putative endonuclease
MTFERKSTGSYGEDLAAEYLKKRGYKILERNFKTKLGEIDILVRAPKPFWRRGKPTIVVVEVKTKSGRSYGAGWEMVNYFKKEKLLLLAKSLQKDYPKSVIRIDIISIDTAFDPPEIRHFENAVEDNV